MVLITSIDDIEAAYEDDLDQAARASQWRRGPYSQEDAFPPPIGDNIILGDE